MEYSYMDGEYINTVNILFNKLLLRQQMLQRLVDVCKRREQTLVNTEYERAREPPGPQTWPVVLPLCAISLKKIERK